jgi:hypothetical protein
MTMLKALLTLTILLAAPLAYSQECPWMAVSHINQAYPDRAPWTTMAGGQGRCKFISDQRKPSSTLSLTQIVESSPQEAQDYAKDVGAGMADSYQVKPDPAIGTAGAAVREQKSADSRMLTLIGHQKNIVVMAQLSFFGGVSEAQQAKAEELTKETFGLDTGGGLKMPKP